MSGPGAVADPQPAEAALAPAAPAEQRPVQARQVAPSKCSTGHVQVQQLQPMPCARWHRYIACAGYLEAPGAKDYPLGGEPAPDVLPTTIVFLGIEGLPAMRVRSAAVCRCLEELSCAYRTSQRGQRV